MSIRAKRGWAAVLPAGLALIALPGCASLHRSAPASPPAVATAPPLRPSPVQYVGRILAIDLAAKIAIVSVSTYASLPPSLVGRALVTRDVSLRPMARLDPTPYLRGQTLGAHILEGEPAVGDEVVLLPPAEVFPPAPAVTSAVENASSRRSP